jgi:hypothetical protein
MKSQSNHNKSLNLVSRASSRLNDLLTDLGYPLDMLGRSTSLAQNCSISARDATNLLSGIVVWSFHDLAVICDTFGKDPGFFLDSGRNSSVPADTTLVTSSDGGESTVWRAPNGFITQRKMPSAPLKYISTTSKGYFGRSPVRTMLVYEDWSQHAGLAIVEPQRGYILEDGDGSLKPMLCIAVFARCMNHDQDRHIVPLLMSPVRDPATQGTHLVGQAIGSIQGY